MPELKTFWDLSVDEKLHFLKKINDEDKKALERHIQQLISYFSAVNEETLDMITTKEQRGSYLLAFMSLLLVVYVNVIPFEINVLRAVLLLFFGIATILCLFLIFPYYRPSLSAFSMPNPADRDKTIVFYSENVSKLDITFTLASKASVVKTKYLLAALSAVGIFVIFLFADMFLTFIYKFVFDAASFVFITLITLILLVFFYLHIHNKFSKIKIKPTLASTLLKELRGQQ